MNKNSSFHKYSLFVKMNSMFHESFLKAHFMTQRDGKDIFKWSSWVCFGKAEEVNSVQPISSYCN